MTSEEEGFLERWSRRKQQPEDDTDALPDVTDQPDEPGELDEASASEPPALTDEDMPDIETLAPDSDVSPFFSPGVSERLRQKALRKIFHTARYNVKDGLDDYDEDFTLLQPLGDTDTWEWRRQRERLVEREKARERKRLEEEVAAEEEAETAETEDEELPEQPPEQSENEPEEK